MLLNKNTMNIKVIDGVKVNNYSCYRFDIEGDFFVVYFVTEGIELTHSIPSYGYTHISVTKLSLWERLVY